MLDFTCRAFYNGWLLMTDTQYIEALIRSSECSKELALSIMSVTMIAYLQGARNMGKKKKEATTKNGTDAKPETPADAFRRLSTSRTNSALKAIRLVGQTAGPSYESTDIEEKAIITALTVAVEGVIKVFAGEGKSSDTFSLPK